MGIELQFLAVESQKTICAGERYREPLRRVFRLVRKKYPSLDPESALRYPVKELNDTI